MKPFLQETAELIMREHPTDADRVAVVFNNRRSGLFLRKHFAQIDRTSFFLPQITVIDDLVARLGRLETVQHEFLLFELYDIHCQIGGPDRKYATFQDFISFGEMMLADFSEIDLYMVDARQLFANLHDDKAIEQWNVDGQAPTPFQENYLAFYGSLYQYYDLLRQRLAATGKAYSGMAYRNVAENIETLVDQSPWDYVYFVGFNVLSRCEEAIIRAYCNRGLGTLLTDGDPYYYDDPRQEAGLFLRRHSRNFGSIGHYASHFDQGRKQIHIVSCPERVLQCKFAGQLLSQHPEWNDDNTQTAIVLADEKLLLPTLNSLPEEVTTANVTMGYPYADSNIHETVLKLFDLYARARGQRFHHTELLDLLTDYHIAHLIGGASLRSRLARRLAADGIVFASCETAEQLLADEGIDPQVLHFVLGQDPTTAVDAFWDICRTLAARLLANDSLLNHKEREALGAMVEMANYLADLQAEHHVVTNLDTLQKIYSRLARRHSISFFGQPLSGLQILGMLETRNLDFRRVVLLSTNEGTLPAGRTPATLVPHDLKKSFGLPTYHEKDAVFAYHFYRLLQRAEEVWLVCSTETNANGKGEPSRFIMQVKQELAPRFAANIEVSRQVVETEFAPTTLHSRTEAAKDDLALQRLEAINARGFSPSALNNYRACPLKFYFENVLGIRKPDEVSEDLDQSDLGTCIHETLQAIFAPVQGRQLQADDLRTALDSLDTTLQARFASLFSDGHAIEGRNHLLYSIARTQVANLLRLELAELEQGRHIDIIGLELPLQHSLQAGPVAVNLAGIADRIDRRAGVVRICDYKTGKVEPADLVMTDSKWRDGKMPDKWFQVMFYALLYNRTTRTTEPTLSGIYPLRHLGRTFMSATWEGEAIIEEPLLDQFEAYVADLAAEALNPAIPFVAAEGCKVCRYCPVQYTCPKSTA